MGALDQNLDISSIYVELDAILDTRIGVIKSFGMEAMIQIIEDDYVVRLSDDFKGIDMAEYKRRYDSRNKLVLRDSVVTPIMRVIRHFAKQTLKANLSTPIHRQPKMILNIFPYELTEEEIKVIISAIAAATDREIDIEVINNDPVTITPSHVKANYTAMVMYHYWDWLNAQMKNKALEETPIPKVGLIAPMICKSKEVEAIASVNDVFSQTELIYSPVIRLMLYPVMFFSIDTAKMADTAKSQQKAK